jgi:hypothetical protein
VTPSDANSILSRITIVWVRYFVSMRFMIPYYL